MKRLNQKALGIILFALFIILADKFIGKILEIIYVNSDELAISQIRYTFNETSEDILIFGSSRAEHHYVPEIISKSTGCTSYNCGLGGQFLTFSYIQISETLKRYKPRLIILDLYPEMLLQKNFDQRLKILAPYYTSDTLIMEILNQSSRFEKFKYISSIYPYNSLLFPLLLGLFYTPDVSDKGFIPVAGTIDTSLVVNKGSGKTHEIVEKQMMTLCEIIRVCQEKKVDLWILVSPIYKTTTQDSKIIQDLEILSKQKCVHFIDFSQNSYFSNYLFFKDNLHLNSNGAIEYSKTVSDSLRSYLNKL
jgi:hypothetical protein